MAEAETPTLSSDSSLTDLPQPSDEEPIPTAFEQNSRDSEILRIKMEPMLLSEGSVEPDVISQHRNGVSSSVLNDISNGHATDMANCHGSQPVATVATVATVTTTTTTVATTVGTTVLAGRRRSHDEDEEDSPIVRRGDGDGGFGKRRRLEGARSIREESAELSTEESSIGTSRLMRQRQALAEVEVEVRNGRALRKRSASVNYNENRANSDVEMEELKATTKRGKDRHTSRIDMQRSSSRDDEAISFKLTSGRETSQGKYNTATEALAPISRTTINPHSIRRRQSDHNGGFDGLKDDDIFQSPIGPRVRRQNDNSLATYDGEEGSQIRRRSGERRYPTRSAGKVNEPKDRRGEGEQDEMQQPRRSSGRLAGKTSTNQREREESKVSSSKYDSEDYDQDDENSEPEEPETYVPTNTKYGFRQRRVTNYNLNGGPPQPRAKASQQNEEENKLSEDSEHAENDDKRREYNLRKRGKLNYAIPPPPSLKDSPTRSKHHTSPRHHRGRDPFRDHRRNDRGDRRNGMPLFGRGSRFGSGAGRGEDSSDSDGMASSPRKSFKHRMGSESGARLLPMNLKELEGTRQDRFPAVAGGGSVIADIDQLGVSQSVNFESVGGLDHHVKSLKEMVVLPLLYPEVYTKFQITPPRGVLFYGPPGTGKTLLARALATSCSTKNQKVAFFMRKGADCLSKWVGEAERQLRLLFEEARAWQPSIIFFDEIDGLAPIRSSKSEQVHASIVSTLLALMDGLDSRGQVIVIGATNRIDAIDPALRRPGRFDREFYFPLPNEAGRRIIVDIQTRNWNPPISNGFKARLAEITKGYSGADIKALCTEAALKAIRRRYPQIYDSVDKLLINPASIKIQERDFLKSAKALVPSSQRSTGPTGVPLPKTLEPLLSLQLGQIIDKLRLLLPDRHKKGVTEDEDEDEEEEEEEESNDENLAIGGGRRLERLDKRIGLAGMQEYRVFRPRLIISGAPGMGQRHIGPALLHHLEGYHVQSFDLATLMSESTRTPEAACIQLFVEVKRHKPSVIYVPNLNTWYNSVSDQLKSTFADLLNDLDSHDPILFLATTDCSFNDLPMPVRHWFFEGILGNTDIKPADTNQRDAFFAELIKDILRPPKRSINNTSEKKRMRELEVLPKAPLPPPKEPTLEQKKALREHDDYVFRELRIELRAMTEDLLKDRRFKPFTKPVDEDLNEAYAEIVKMPMDLYTILQKVNSRQYLTLKEYTSDIDLIRMNAELFYGVGTDLSSRAAGLLDEVESMMYRLNPDLVSELKISAARRRHEIEGYSSSKGKQPQRDSMPPLPAGQRFSHRVRGIAPVVTKLPEEHIRKPVKGAEVEFGEGLMDLEVGSESRAIIAEKSEQNGESSGMQEPDAVIITELTEGSQVSPIQGTTVAGGFTSLANSSLDVFEVAAGADENEIVTISEQIDERVFAMDVEKIVADADIVMANLGPVEAKEAACQPSSAPVFSVDENMTYEIRDMLVSATSGLTVEQLDHLRASLYLLLWKHRHEWDRAELLKEMKDLIGNRIEVCDYLRAEVEGRSVEF